MPSAPYAITDAATVRANLVTNCQGNFTDLYSRFDTATLSAVEWLSNSYTPTHASSTSFTIPSDVTTTFTEGRRVRADLAGGAVYGTIASSSYSTVTTVILEEAVLDNTLSAVYLGILSGSEPSRSFPASSIGMCDQVILAVEMFAR